jgi:hypothetical protein
MSRAAAAAQLRPKTGGKRTQTLQPFANFCIDAVLLGSLLKGQTKGCGRNKRLPKAHFS